VTEVSAARTPETTETAAAQSASDTVDSAAPDVAELIAAEVSTCSGTASLSGGKFGEVATYLPGRRVIGVRITGDVVEIHVVATWGRTLPEVAEEIRTACLPLAPGRRIDVVIEDVELPFPEHAGSSADGEESRRGSGRAASGAT
jgi:hypothetical protein